MNTSENYVVAGTSGGYVNVRCPACKGELTFLTDTWSADLAIEWMHAHYEHAGRVVNGAPANPCPVAEIDAPTRNEVVRGLRNADWTER